MGRGKNRIRFYSAEGMRIDIILKLLGSILIIISGYGIGQSFCKKLKQRIEELKELKRIGYIFQGNIRFGNCTLPEIAGEFVEKDNCVFSSFFKEILERTSCIQGKCFEEIWNNAIDNKMTDNALTIQDKNEFKKIGYIAGKMDKQMQYDNLNLFIQTIDEKITELNKDYGEKSRMYKLLGICFSIALVIIII